MDDCTENKQTRQMSRGVWIYAILILAGTCIVVTFHWNGIHDNILSFVIDSTSPNISNGLNEEGNDLCTLRKFRHSYNVSGYFPSKGKWDNGTTALPRYQLDLCSFQYTRYPQDKLAACLNTANIHSVITFGDSNGKRNAGALLDLFNQSAGDHHGNCVLTTDEQLVNKGFVPDQTFYANSSNQWARFMVIGKRKCRTCFGARWKCHSITNNASHEIQFEHLPGMNMIDDSITIVPNASTDNAHKPGNNMPSAASTQEFYFKYFLSGRYPDIFVFFMPFNHAMWKDEHLYVEDMKQFKRLIDKYIPRTTKVFFVPTFSEFPSRYTNPVLKQSAQGFRNQRIHNLNRALFETMKEDFLSDQSSRYGFLDLYTISLGKRMWSKDGVHMLPMWYKLVMSMFWESLCNSVNINEF